MVQRMMAIPRENLQDTVVFKHVNSTPDTSDKRTYTDYNLKYVSLSESKSLAKNGADLVLVNTCKMIYDMQNSDGIEDTSVFDVDDLVMYGRKKYVIKGVTAVKNNDCSIHHYVIDLV